MDLALLGEFPRLKRLWMSTEELARSGFGFGLGLGLGFGFG